MMKREKRTLKIRNFLKGRRTRILYRLCQTLHFRQLHDGSDLWGCRPVMAQTLDDLWWCRPMMVRQVMMQTQFRNSPDGTIWLKNSTLCSEARASQLLHWLWHFIHYDHIKVTVNSVNTTSFYRFDCALTHPCYETVRNSHLEMLFLNCM